MVDWKTIKCTQCESKNFCRKRSITKGSEICQVKKKIIPPRKRDKDGVSEGAASSALLWSFAQNAKKDKE